VRHQGVTWSVTADDFAELGPGWVLAGTFQATSARSGRPQHLAELVPAADGLHFVLVHTQEQSQLRAFIRAGGELRPAGEQPVMINDWAAVIDAAEPRLTLA
jgi:hypothetical protein